MDMHRFLVTLIIVLSGCTWSVVEGQPPGPKPPPSYTKELESELRQYLFDGYEVMQRPQKIVNVQTALNLLSLNTLDIREQKMSIAGYFHFVWGDSRLQWYQNSNYSNIRFLFTNENNVWTPAIIIENSVEDIDVISKPKVPMRVGNWGKIAWMPSGIYTTSCESDVTYWPLDTQKCDIIISSWGYTANEVTLTFNDDIFVTTFYKENGEWELVNTNYSSVTTEREKESFSRLIFSVTYRRRPLFHLLNTLFPVVLMGFLTVAIFKLSPESGERVGLALTILLAYAVYLSLISESIPQTSISASLLSTYLASILLLQTLAVFLTVFYLDIYFRPKKKPVPAWFQTLASSCLSKLVCIDCCCERRVKPFPPEDGVTPFPPEDADIDITPEVVISEKKIGLKRPISVESNERPHKPAWLNGDDDDDDGDAVTDFKYSWKEIALMLDKITMYVYLVFVCGFTSLTFGVMVQHYNTAYTLF